MNGTNQEYNQAKNSHSLPDDFHITDTKYECHLYQRTTSMPN